MHVTRLTSVMICAIGIFTGCRGSPRTPNASAALSDGDVIKNQQEARTDTDRAFALLGDSKFDQAEGWLIKAIAADPLYGPAHNDLGLVYFHRADQNRAADDLYHAAWEFENASKLMPRQAAPLNNLGLVREKADELPEAAKSYTAAVALDPDNTEYAGNYARVRIKMGQRDQITGKLLDLIIMKDRRPQWVSWAREQRSRLKREVPE